MHDFQFYRIDITAVRYIGGFGKIHWLEPASYHAPVNQLAELEDGILEHMNNDHVEALINLCRHVHQLQVESAAMIGIDCDGFDLRAEAKCCASNSLTRCSMRQARAPRWRRWPGPRVHDPHP